MPGGMGDYARDLATLIDWAPGLVITMTGQAELVASGAGGLGADLEAAGIGWRHVALPDFGVPDAVTDALWPAVAAEARAVLQVGGGVVAHCMGGCGRSGMALLRLMVEMGEDAEAALARLRDVRPCAVETGEQLAWARAGRVV